jgi:hypothetical protein
VHKDDLSQTGSEGIISPMNTVPPRSRRTGIGCLPGLLILALLGPLVVMTVDLIFAPWIYSVGGRTRLLPVWAGVGIAQTSSGPYAIRIWFSPTPSGSRILPSTSISGSAYVCTPTGKRYTLRVTGGASGQIWKNMDGHAFHLSAYHRPAFASLTGDRRPRLNFSGSWVGPDLKMNDEGSIAHAFLADGNLSSGANGSHPKDSAVPITFAETSWWVQGSCSEP